ncbi:DNA cross-link repair 1A protein isoform X2 [Heptranchias perlo]|uniref:DNA cross-link repair 1A protein isoform X2 n=1 Tax=Heptranchias perlo TaxID=212740 RepID=UPI00355A23AE
MCENGTAEEEIWDYKTLRKLRRPVNTTEANSPSPEKSASWPKAEQKRSGGGGNRPPFGRKGKGSCSKKSGAECHHRDQSARTDHVTRGKGALSSQDLTPPASNASKAVEQITRNPLSRGGSSSTPPKATECTNVPEGKQIPTNVRPVHDGYCPICQIPFSLLLIETPRWHVAECLDTPSCTDNECPDGLLCNNTIPRHYKRYSHLLLAENRALGQSDVQSTFLSSTVRDALAVSSDLNNNHQSLQNSQSIQIEGSLTNQNQNALLFLKSPTIKATKKSSRATKGKTSPSEKVLKGNVTRLQISSQSAASPGNRHIGLPHSASQLTPEVELGINKDGLFNEATINSTVIELKSFSEDESTFFVLASNANYSEDDISYSPLCSDDEIPDQKRLSFTRKRLFHGQTINHNCKSEDDTCSDFGKLKHHGQELVHKSSGLKDTVITDVEAITIDPDSSLLNDSVNIPTKNRKGIATQPQQAKAVLSAHNWIPLDKKIKQVHNWPKPNLTGSNLIKLEPVHSSSDSLLEPLQIKQEPSESFQFTQSAVVQELCDSQTRKEKRDNSSCPTKTSLSDTQHSLVLPSLNTVKQGSSCSNTLISSQSVGVQKSRTKTLEMASLGLLGRDPIKIPKRSAVNKELKQTDIGVFFGLKPKIKEECPKSTPQRKAKELISEVSYNEKRQKQRKRKVESSVGDEACTGTVDNLQTDPGDGQQRRTKRQRAGVNTYKKNKQCPFYKMIPGTNFTVDAFQYGVVEGCTAYFLTHFHSDHYGGLTKNFKCPIYCSTITGNLVRSKLKVQDQYIISLPMNSECVVDGVKVVLLDANHCPGAVMLRFQLPNGKALLHTGDFRANTSMERYSHLVGQKIHTLYLDTTYCSPEYTFPSQQEAIQFVVNVAFETVTMNPRTLVVCGTYSIGKEKVFLGFTSTHEQVPRKV